MTIREPFKDLADLAAFLRTMDNGPDAEMGFDMKKTNLSARYSKHPCGTACCIGGLVRWLNKIDDTVSLPDAVLSISPEGSRWWAAVELCYPDEWSAAWDATPEQAADAVDAFAAGHPAPWAAVFGGKE